MFAYLLLRWAPYYSITISLNKRNFQLIIYIRCLLSNGAISSPLQSPPLTHESVAVFAVFIIVIHTLNCITVFSLNFFDRLLKFPFRNESRLVRNDENILIPNEQYQFFFCWRRSLSYWVKQLRNISGMLGILLPYSLGNQRIEWGKLIAKINCIIFC